jgi:hypothetical protein
MAQQMLSQVQLKEMEEALRERICSVCVDRSLEGICRLEAERECALFNSFPQIVLAVSRVRSAVMDDYVAAIRNAVCSRCAHQDADGFCGVRDEVRCILDRYLLLIVQTIEEIRDQTLKSGQRLDQIAEAENA